MTDLSGQVALVTGASRGIGAAAAVRLARAGASVVLAARTAGELDAVAAGIRDAGGTADAVPCDVTDYAQVAAAVAHAIAHFGGLDILVNNAGVIEPIARLADSDPALWDLAVDINVKGVYHGLRAALPHMAGRGRGTVINISSGAATGPLEGWSHYCATKAAALMLTRSADLEYRDAGVRVVGLSPGTVATDMQVTIRQSGINPISQMDPSVHIPADWVGQAVVFLCSPGGEAYAGTDFSLKTPEGRRAASLPE